MNQGQNRKGVGVCIPTAYRDTHLSWAFAFKGLDGPINWHTAWHIIENKPVDQARNEGAEWALANNLKYLFFLGDDTIVPSHTLQRFIFIMENNPQINVLGGVYFCKSDPTFPLIFMGPGEGSYWDWKVGELIKVWGVGMDATMVRTDTFEKLKKPWFVTAKANSSIDGLPRAEAWTEDLWFCFAPGQMVYGDMLDVDGHVAGNQVLTHTGRVREVEETIERNYSGVMLKVKPKYGAPFEVTPNHPILLDVNGEKIFTKAESIKKGDKLVVPIPGRVREDREDWLLASPFRTKFVEFRDNKFRYIRTHADSQYFPLKSPITKSFCSLLGYWLAEGSTPSDEYVDFTFHESEREFADDVVRLLMEVCGLRATITHNEERRTLSVICICSGLVDFLNYHFGRGASSKRIPEELLFASPDRVKFLLRSLWKGDGNKVDRGRGIVTVSRSLAHGIRLMLIRLGIYSSLFERKDDLYSTGIAYRVDPCSEFQDEWRAIIGSEPLIRNRRMKMPWLERHFNNGLISDGGHFSVAVEEIQSYIYDGPVFNLKVKEDKSYNVNGFAVHNCEKLAKAGGGKLKGGVYVDTSVQCQHYDSGSKRMFQLPPNCKPSLRQFAVGDKQILDLGCGGSDIVLKDGVPVRVDLREDVEVDYRCDLRALPFKSESWDIVFSMATLERFPHPQIPAVLDEWLRLLKPKGELKLIVADLEAIAKDIIKGKLDLNMLYGGQDQPHNFRRAGFTSKTLRTLLESKGLRVKKIWQEAPYWLFSQSIKEKAREVIGDFEGQGILKESGKMNESADEKPVEIRKKLKPVKRGDVKCRVLATK